MLSEYLKALCVFVLGTFRKMEYCTQHVLRAVQALLGSLGIAFIFTRYCLFLMFYRFMYMIENLLSKNKMYIEGALMCKYFIIFGMLQKLAEKGC